MVCGGLGWFAVFRRCVVFDVYFLAVNFDWSIILIRKSFGAFRHISGKLGVKLAILEGRPPDKVTLKKCFKIDQA